jgi:hypothetical protein
LRLIILYLGSARLIANSSTTGVQQVTRPQVATVPPITTDAWRVMHFTLLSNVQPTIYL